jgi:hypothetical protein
VCKTSHMRHQSGPGAPGGWRARRGKRLDGPQHNAADIGEQGHLRGPLRRAWSSNRWQQVKLRQPGTGQPSGLVGCPPGGDGPRRFRGAGPAGAETRFRAHCRLCMARQTRRSPTRRSAAGIAASRAGMFAACRARSRRVRPSIVPHWHGSVDAPDAGFVMRRFGSVIGRVANVEIPWRRAPSM